MSTAAMPVHVGLVDETGQIGTTVLQRVAGVLNEQIQFDFTPVWHVSASVGAYTPGALSKVTWAIYIQSKLDQPGAMGYHVNDTYNQPLAFVKYNRDWPLTVSHELLEMLADPFGQRLHSARLPLGLESDYRAFDLASDSSHVHYLLEICDPCEAVGYDVGGVKLSDFLTPYWYRSNPPVTQVSYSVAGGCAQRRQIAPGGYVSFCNRNGDWFQVFNNDGLQVEELGRFNRTQFLSLREFTDFHANSNTNHNKSKQKRTK